MVLRSHRYLEDFGRDSPAICGPRGCFFHKFDFDRVLPASKSREPSAIVFFAALVPWFNQVTMRALKNVLYCLKGRVPLKKMFEFAEMLRNIRPIDWYHSPPPPPLLFHVTVPLTSKEFLHNLAFWIMVPCISVRPLIKCCPEYQAVKTAGYLSDVT